MLCLLRCAVVVGGLSPLRRRGAVVGLEGLGAMRLAGIVDELSPGVQITNLIWNPQTVLRAPPGIPPGSFLVYMWSGDLVELKVRWSRV